MSYAQPDALVSTDWLAERLNDSGIRIVDATWYLPTDGRNGRETYDAGHIPGAVFWDIDAIADPADPLPHMVPDAAAFAHHMADLGIGEGTQVVVYDDIGGMTAPRIWWTLRYFGHERVAVLNGGMAKWRAEDRPVDTSVRETGDGSFNARVHPDRIQELADMKRNLDGKTRQVLDARGAGRFAGTDPEPRPECRSGHIPGSLNLPFTQLYDADTGEFADAETLKQRFDAAGIDMSKPVTTTCGSGVTACVLALGLHLLGHDDVAVYDGSWTEWGSRTDTPVET